MTAKSLPKDLLEQALGLATKESKRPKQASLRRAVSSAYYSLFHLLCSDASELLAPNLSVEGRSRVQRWFDHSALKETCGKFLSIPLQSNVRDLLGATSSSADLQRVARTFIELQNARHLADYDMSWNVSRSETFGYLQQVQDATDAWLRIRRSAEANIFILLILLWKQSERPR